MFPAERLAHLPPRNIIERTRLKIFYPAWREYRSICESPELFPKYITDNPFIIVHAGYTKYMTVSEDYNTHPDKYGGYVQNIQTAISSALLENRSVLLFTMADYLEQTLSILHPPKEIILVPTVYNRTEANSAIVKRSFFALLTNHLSHAEICGEYGDWCVLAFAASLADKVAIRLNDACIYPPDFKDKAVAKVESFKNIRAAENKTVKRIAFLLDYYYFPPSTDQGLDNLIRAFS